MKRATIKDIANLVGVSISTVSRALKDHPDIGAELRGKIKEVAVALNYRPNMAAVQLRKQKSNLIGLIYPEAHMFFFPSVIKGISEVVQKHGYKLLVLQSNESYEQEIENVRICLDNGVEGLLISISKETKQLSHLEELKNVDIPVVLIDKVLENNQFDEIIIDDAKATRMCIEYLIHTGCRRILGLFGNPNMVITAKRLEGFKQVVAKQNEAQMVVSQHNFVGNTFDTWQQLEQIYPTFKPDGIFAMSDEIMAGIVPALKRLHVNIPEQCSVIGMSDGYLPKILDPQITFLHHDGLALGKLAASHLIDKIQNGDAQDVARHILLPIELVVGNSTK
jgi:LacI family transcriptional regulator